MELKEIEKDINSVSKFRNKVPDLLYKKITDGIETCNFVQSTKKLIIPSNRKTNYMRFEEFKKRIKNGEKLDDIRKITSKHLVAFYSALLQGKINLSKEDFEKDYDSGMTLEEISKKHNIQWRFVAKLREFYGIKRKGAKYIQRIAKNKVEIPLSQEAKDIIIGSMLGDGRIGPDAAYREKHSEKQKDYLQWKASFFKSISNDNSCKYSESIDKRSGTLIKSHSFRTVYHTWLKEMHKVFYREIMKGEFRKIVPNNIEEMLSPLALSVWFMDDGQTCWPYRNGKRTWDGSRHSCKICTDSFTREEVQTLVDALKNRYGINSYISVRTNDAIEKEYLRIKIGCEDTPKFFDIIRPYVHNDLLYKIDEQAYVKKYLEEKPLEKHNDRMDKKEDFGEMGIDNCNIQ